MVCSFIYSTFDLIVKSEKVSIALSSIFLGTQISFSAKARYNSPFIFLANKWGESFFFVIISTP